MSESTEEEKAAAALAVLVDQLSAASRRSRQDAAHDIESIARVSPERLTPHVGKLIEALGRPEAQTRWEVLSALSEMVQVDANAVTDAFEGAESSLFDEGSATVRLAAFCFLARLGATGARMSDEAWPLLDEAVQCYHGDPEYRDMLACLLDFAHGELSEATSHALAARVGFDAENGRGYIRSFSEQIAAALAR